MGLGDTVSGTILKLESILGVTQGKTRWKIYYVAQIVIIKSLVSTPWVI